MLANERTSVALEASLLASCFMRRFLSFVENDTPFEQFWMDLWKSFSLRDATREVYGSWAPSRRSIPDWWQFVGGCLRTSPLSSAERDAEKWFGPLHVNRTLGVFCQVAFHEHASDPCSTACLEDTAKKLESLEDLEGYRADALGFLRRLLLR